nr:PREDICTED: translation initiation factor IF-2-like [Lepisosteus oculatus]
MNGSEGRSDRGKSTPRPARALDTVVCVGKAIGQRSPTRDQRGAGTRTATAPHQVRRGTTGPPSAGNTQKEDPQWPLGAARTAEPLRSPAEGIPVSPAGGSRKPTQRSPGQRGLGGTGRVWSRTSCLQPLLPVELCGPPISQCSGIMPGRNRRNSHPPHQACPLCSCPVRVVRVQARGQPRASRPARLRQLFEVMLEEDAPPTSGRPVVQASGGRHTGPSRAGPPQAPARGTGTPTPPLPARDGLLLQLARLDLRTGPGEEGRAGSWGVRTKDHALPRLRFPTPGPEPEPDPDPDPERRAGRDPPVVDVPPPRGGRGAPARGSAGPGERAPGLAFPGGQAGGWDPALFEVTLVRRDATGQHLETVCCSPGAPERKRSRPEPERPC